MDIITLGSQTDMIMLFSEVGAVIAAAAIIVYLKRYKSKLRQFILRHPEQD
jgi:hypothetical protein